MHIPTAPHGPATLTAAQIRQQLDVTDSWEDGPILPPFPGQRRSPENPKPKIPGQRGNAYNDIVLRYGEHAANSAF
jgi:hypothetical protein